MKQKNRILEQKGDNGLETTYLEHKGIFDISGREFLSTTKTKELIEEIDEVIQRHTDRKYHVRLIISSSESSY